MENFDDKVFRDKARQSARLERHLSRRAQSNSVLKGADRDVATLPCFQFREIASDPERECIISSLNAAARSGRYS